MVSSKDKSSGIRERFRRYTDLLREIENQTERLAALSLVSGAPGGSAGFGLEMTGRAQGTPSDRVGQGVIRMEELREEIGGLCRAEKEERAALEGYISGLSDPDERAVLRMRYFDRLTWDVIGERLHYSVTWVYVLHRRAMKKTASAERLQ